MSLSSTVNIFDWNEIQNPKTLRNSNCKSNVQTFEISENLWMLDETSHQTSSTGKFILLHRIMLDEALPLNKFFQHHPAWFFSSFSKLYKSFNCAKHFNISSNMAKTWCWMKCWTGLLRPLFLRSVKSIQHFIQNGIFIMLDKMLIGLTRPSVCETIKPVVTAWEHTFLWNTINIHINTEFLYSIVCNSSFKSHRSSRHRYSTKSCC